MSSRAGRNQRRDRERKRRQASESDRAARDAAEAARYGVKPVPKVPSGARPPRPDFSEIDWDALRADYPEGARGLLRAMCMALIGDRAANAKKFLPWGLQPNPVHPKSRLAQDNAAVTLDDAPDLVSQTALYPTMNASEHLTAAAEVISFALLQGQIRTSATAALCRIAMESSAKTIWLISETDTEERIRRCYGFLKAERGRQEEFERLEAEALDARTDELFEADRAKFEERRVRVAARQAQIEALPPESITGPTGGPLKLVASAEKWMDERLPRPPDPDLDKVLYLRSARSFYSLGSGFVHGFKWLMPYVLDEGELDDTPLLAITLDAFNNAIRMTASAVALFEAQSIGPQRDPRRFRNYPDGLEDMVTDLAADYRLPAGG
jgi:hypothetical protein